MQVRKFEAKTMKDALELVKQNLGPEAIILSARDNSRGFGLMGEKSVEVTAAVSEETLRKKRLAEAKMRESAKNRFMQAPARVQKQFIDRAYNRAMAPAQEMVDTAGAPIARREKSHGTFSAPAPRPTSQLYIDIADEEPAVASGQRIRDAAYRARAASQGVMAETRRPGPAPIAAQPVVAGKTAETERLEFQIGELKTMLEKFNKIPQTMITAHPGAEEGISYELSHAYQRLQKAGVQTEIIVDWLKMRGRKSIARVPKSRILWTHGSFRKF